MNSTTIFFVYEPNHLEVLRARLASIEMPYTIVALDYWTERAFIEAGFPCVSLCATRAIWTDFSSQLKTVETIAREWYRIPSMAFFEHRGIKIAESIEVGIQFHVGQALLYVEALTRVLEQYPFVQSIIVPTSSKNVPAGGGPFVVFERNLIVDTVRFLAQTRKLSIEIVGVPARVSLHQAFPPQSRMKLFAIALFNTVMSLTARLKPIRIYASEYWSHIEEAIEDMNDINLALMDREQVKWIPWRALWKHRVRFLHPLSEHSSAVRTLSKERQAYFKEQWNSAREAVSALPGFSFEDSHWWSIVEPAFEFIVNTYAERIVSDIEGIRAILIREKINRVLVRASVSAQHHFFVLCRLAYDLGIPSIEIQHGMGSFIPSSVDSLLNASYLASYGPFVREMQIKNNHVIPDRIRDIGSPRFDHYADIARPEGDERVAQLNTLGLSADAPVITVAVPAEVMSFSWSHYSSFEVVDFFRQLAEVKKNIPSLQFIFKFRPGYSTPAVRAFIAELFSGDVAIADRESIFPLLLLGDMVISGPSTVLCEAMIAEKPLILFPWRREDTHIEMYRSAGAYATNSHELEEIIHRIVEDSTYRTELTEKGRAFLSRNYIFDGHASERTARLLRENLPVFESKRN